MCVCVCGERELFKDNISGPNVHANQLDFQEFFNLEDSVIMETYNHKVSMSWNNVSGDLRTTEQ